MARSAFPIKLVENQFWIFNEKLAGVRPFDNITPISPFIVPDDPIAGYCLWLRTIMGNNREQ
jgi:hypothetical protein